jgi:hypothetical protein
MTKPRGDAVAPLSFGPVVAVCWAKNASSAAPISATWSIVRQRCNALGVCYDTGTRDWAPLNEVFTAASMPPRRPIDGGCLPVNVGEQVGPPYDLVLLQVGLMPASCDTSIRAAPPSCPTGPMPRR